ncbi:cell wall-binding repeat-containing protein [Cellulosimicrobium protaetiae]|uniref:Cell wall-binding repeat-containing protein n=1 Tax=Cellulosimicrobium protaetiae TaxID=2587808 RepID=A0A6M5UES2_9MICO|nr:cell wall-binding repeat-containing protein [Cellulosimicrobium protaetiae]QJW36122.1 cell wall-binding repeat-containing protein [Cellulosimicrobium protaetiae]
MATPLRGADLDRRTPVRARRVARALLASTLALTVVGAVGTVAGAHTLSTPDTTVGIDGLGGEAQAFREVLASRVTPERAAELEEQAATLAATLAGTDRVSGKDRYETAAGVSYGMFDSGVPVVYIASGAGFADALSAAPAAAVQGGPLLLVQPNGIPAVVAAELQRLAPQRIVVVGGTGAVSNAVYSQLAAYAPSIRRDSGADRYATSRLVSQRAFGGGVAVEAAYVATGTDFPDALSAGAVAGGAGVPVILVNGKAGSVDAATKQLLQTLGVYAVGIAGGNGAVSAGIEADLADEPNIDGFVARYAGKNRYETSVALNQDAYLWANGAFLATGAGYADALAGAAAAGSVSVPLWVVPSSCVPGAVLTKGSELGVGTYILLGGRGALGDGVAALSRC